MIRSLIVLIVLGAGCQGRNPDDTPVGLTVTPPTTTRSVGELAPLTVTSINALGSPVEVQWDSGAITLEGITGDLAGPYTEEGFTARYLPGSGDQTEEVLNFRCAAVVDRAMVTVALPNHGVSDEAEINCEEVAATYADEMFLANLRVGTWNQSLFELGGFGSTAALHLTDPDLNDELEQISPHCVLRGRSSLASRPAPSAEVNTSAQAFDFVQDSDGLITAEGLEVGPMFDGSNAAEITIGAGEAITSSHAVPDDTFTWVGVDATGGTLLLEVRSEIAPSDAQVRLISSWEGAGTAVTQLECSWPADSWAADGAGFVLIEDLGAAPTSQQDDYVAPESILMALYSEEVLDSAELERPLPIRLGQAVRFDKADGFHLWGTPPPSEDLIPVPATQPMGFAGAVAICQDSNGTFHFQSSPAGLCPFVAPGTTIEPVLIFRAEAGTVTAGNTLVGGSPMSVDLVSTTEGILVDGSPDQVEDLPVDTTVQIESTEHRTTFSFPDATSIEVTEFKPLP